MSTHTAKGTTALPTYSFNTDTDTGFHSPAANTVSVVCGGSEVGRVSSSVKMPMCVKVASITGTSSSSGVFSATANPFGYNVLITGAYLRITTQSSGASTMDIGVGANATTSNDGLIDGLSGAAAGLFTNFEDASTNGEVSQVWSTTGYLNVAEASGDVDGLVADLYVTVVQL